MTNNVTNNVTYGIIISDGGHVMNFGKENELLEFKSTIKELDDSLIDISPRIWN